MLIQRWGDWINGRGLIMIFVDGQNEMDSMFHDQLPCIESLSLGLQLTVLAVSIKFKVKDG